VLVYFECVWGNAIGLEHYIFEELCSTLAYFADIHIP
jgi:hypothetical protein